jgi:hypothetical protein
MAVVLDPVLHKQVKLIQAAEEVDQHGPLVHLLLVQVLELLLFVNQKVHLRLQGYGQ